MTVSQYWENLPARLKRLTLFVALPVCGGFGLLVVSGVMFAHPRVTTVLFGLCFLVGALHTARAFWQFGRTSD